MMDGDKLLIRIPRQIRPHYRPRTTSCQDVFRRPIHYIVLAWVPPFYIFADHLDASIQMMVPRGRVELPLSCENRILSPARLPVPPSGHKNHRHLIPLLDRSEYGEVLF